MDEFVTIARIVKKRGVRGEVAAELLTDFPERFSTLKRVRLYKGEHEHWEELEKHWFHQGRVILKFRRKDRPEDVQELIGSDVQVPRSDRFPIPEDTYYYSDLIGCEVREEGHSIGAVCEVYEVEGQARNLVVEARDGSEFMIPLVHEFIKKINTKKKVIDVKLPSGLMSL